VQPFKAQCLNKNFLATKRGLSPALTEKNRV